MESQGLSIDVSRETVERLREYEVLLRKWNPVINLVSRSTLDQIWKRHFSDSATAYQASIFQGKRVVDMGSGGGLPGLVLAILCKGDELGTKFTLIEADIRKCEFLRTVSRNLDLDVNVTSRRIEDVPNQNAEVATARALAPLTKLLGFAEQHLSKDGRAFFHKGVTWQEEEADARKSWSFQLNAHESKVEGGASVLEIWDIVRV